MSKKGIGVTQQDTDSSQADDKFLEPRITDQGFEKRRKRHDKKEDQKWNIGFAGIKEHRQDAGLLA